MPSGQKMAMIPRAEVLNKIRILFLGPLYKYNHNTTGSALYCTFCRNVSMKEAIVHEFHREEQVGPKDRLISMR